MGDMLGSSPEPVLRMTTVRLLLLALQLALIAACAHTERAAAPPQQVAPYGVLKVTGLT